jgi:hypothetical protein
VVLVLELREREASGRIVALLGSVGVALALASCGGHDVELTRHGGGGAAGAGGLSAASLTFCDVAPILETKCQICHSDPPEHGAPFPLVSYADTQGPTSSQNPNDARPVRMHEAIESGFMPYLRLSLDPPAQALTCEEKQTLLAWLAEGAPPGAECSSKTPRQLACPAGSAGTGGNR